MRMMDRIVESFINGTPSSGIFSAAKVAVLRKGKFVKISAISVYLENPLSMRAEAWTPNLI
jgi:hypothetical protein